MWITVAFYLYFIIPVSSHNSHETEHIRHEPLDISRENNYLRYDIITDLNDDLDTGLNNPDLNPDSSQAHHYPMTDSEEHSLFNRDVDEAMHHLSKRAFKDRIDAKIEVLVVVDNSVYRYYMKKSRNREKVALARIRRYYGMVFAMVDQRFQTIKDYQLSITIKISGFHIAKSRQDSSWLEYVVEWGKGGTVAKVDVNAALRRFQKWLRTKDDIPKHDHAMVFTRYLLVTRGTVEVGGMAFVDSICKTEDGSSSSIVVDLGDFQCVKVATHELGHSLGAGHDGEGKSADCLPNNYIMATQNTNRKSTLKNAFLFSPCSIRQFKLLIGSEQGKCVHDIPIIHYQYNLARRPPGQIYNVGNQCKLIFGKKSGFCHKGKRRSSMCGQLWCRDPIDPRTCRTHSYLTALPGTNCGGAKVCHLGDCLRDPNSAVPFTPRVTNKIRIGRGRTSSTSRNQVTNRINRTHKTSARMARPRMRRPRTRSRQRSRLRRKPATCVDKNETYCKGILDVNPRACRRRQLREYCCSTCYNRR